MDNQTKSIGTKSKGAYLLPMHPPPDAHGSGIAVDSGEHAYRKGAVLRGRMNVGRILV
jgi:hypothetical protein